VKSTTAASRAVAQRRAERRLQVIRKVAFRFGFCDRRVLGITQMTVPDCPEPRRAYVWMRPPFKIKFGYPVKSLKSLRQINGCLRDCDHSLRHNRTRSNTRPRNQKFSTPDHSA
jgi:hypothetical protein